MEILQFVFSSFWIWLGTLLLLGAVGEAVARFRPINITIRKN